VSVEAERLVYRLSEVAVMVGVDPKTITRWEEKGKFPRRLDFDSIVVYDRGEVDVWFQKRHRKAGRVMGKVQAFIRKRKDRSPFFLLCWRLVGERRYSERSLGVRDEQVANQMLSKFIREKEDEAAGLVAPKSYRDAAAKSVADHMTDYVSFLRGKGCDADYVLRVGYRLKALREFCGWERFVDVTPDSFIRWRDDPETLKKAVKTRNDYVDDACSWCTWMVGQVRIPSAPLTRLVLRVETRGVEPSRERRALTDAQLGRLLAVAGAFKPFVVAGHLTGLRLSELAGLRWSDVHLDAVKPFLLARVSTTKNGKLGEVPLRDDLVAELRKLRGAGRDDLARVFTAVPDMDQWCGLLEKAAIPYKDEMERQAGVHSLRKTFNTNLARAGVDREVRKKLMRVTDARLVEVTYLDSSQIGLGDALEGLPRFDEVAGAEVLSATGTGGGDYPVKCPVEIVKLRQSVSKGVKGSGGGEVRKGLISRGKCPSLSIPAENAEMRHVGLEPTTR
jgi:integrase/predicted DNA-binding transcriptional regulator AlpA